MEYDEDDDEVLYLSSDEIDNLLDKLKKEDRDIVEIIMSQNSTLLDCIVDLQEFMRDKGYNSKDFKAWVDKKETRTYH